jgi:hypothetical protein
MNTANQPLPRDRATALRSWLWQRVLGEAIYQFLEGLVFLIFGVFIFGCFIYLPIIVLFMYFNLDFDIPNFFVTAIVFFLILAFWFLLASKNKLGPTYAGHKKTEAGPVYQSISSLMLAAPDQILASFECLQKAIRLLRCDIPHVSVILLWLYDRRKKATVEEICTGLSGDDSVRLLPQLRDIPGVIWLSYGHGVIILSLDLRYNIASTLNEWTRQSRAETYSEDWQKSSETPDAESTQDKEMIAWYLTLNLPPFTNLEAVKRRYRQLVKIHHPDAVHRRLRGSTATSDDQIKRINAAYHNIIQRAKSDVRGF